VIWYADYYGVPETPYQFTFWQYTDLGWVSGIAETETDLNLWFVKNEEEEEAPAEEASDQAAEGASAPAKDAAEASSGKADQTEEKAGAADQTEDKAGAADQTKEGTADQAPSAESAQPAGTP
jgi:hypothetical protein